MYRGIDHGIDGMIRCAVSDCAFQCELVVILIDNAKLAAVHGDQAIGLARSGLRDTEGVVETIKAALIKSDAAAESMLPVRTIVPSPF